MLRSMAPRLLAAVRPATSLVSHRHSHSLRNAVYTGQPFIAYPPVVTDLAANVQPNTDALVVGCFANGKPTNVTYALDRLSGGALMRAVQLTARSPSAVGAPSLTEVLYNVPGLPVSRICVVGLGPELSAVDGAAVSAAHSVNGGSTSAPTKKPAVVPSADQFRENVRSAVARGVAELSKSGAKKILVEDFGDAQASAEGLMLGAFHYRTPTPLPDNSEKQFDDSKMAPVDFAFFDPTADPRKAERWLAGCTVGHAQNLARRWAELPANRLTPTTFANFVSSALEGLPGIRNVFAHPLQWIESQRMNAFLAVARGAASHTAPIFLVVEYDPSQNSSTDAAPPAAVADRSDDHQSVFRPTLALVGKGVTFDSGGISIKPSEGMGYMRGDMGGAATVMAVVRALAELRCPVPLVAVAPLCENMPGPASVHPGDVITARSGLEIEVDNTDAEGRLILADALHFVGTAYPTATSVLDVATLTGAMDVALGAAATGVFCTSDKTFDRLQKAGARTGDPMWRMPLLPDYDEQIRSSIADIKNVGGRAGGACTAAAFLRRFVSPTVTDWAHLDIAGVAWARGSHTYLRDRMMTGRPVRALVEYIRSLSGGGSAPSEH